MVKVREWPWSWLKETSIDCWLEIANEQRSPMSKSDILNVNRCHFGAHSEISFSWEDSQDICRWHTISLTGLIYIKKKTTLCPDPKNTLSPRAYFVEYFCVNEQNANSFVLQEDLG